MQRNLFGTTDGVICVSNLQELIMSSSTLRKHIAGHARKGATVKINGHLRRLDNGCVELNATTIAVMSSHS